ncbi:MAG: beta-galactosidase, partial [Kiritimatiellae bacterium]|nr:beta-galactosidase [Kiritimatiellia bacterium]
SSILALGGPGILERGAPPGPLFIDMPVAPGNLIPNGGFESGGATDPFLPQEWRMAEDGFAFRAGEVKAMAADAISGARSLEINTLESGSGKRKLYTRFSVDLDKVYEVSFKGRNLGGDGYVTVSVRSGLGAPNVEYVGAVADSTAKGAIRLGATGLDRAYTFFDAPDLCLVIEAHGPIHAVLDDICVVPAPSAKQWSTFEPQRAPWPRASDWDALSTNVVTPHIPWMRPRDGAPLRAITLMPRPIHRRTLEIAQRIALEAVPVFFESFTSTKRGIGPDYWVHDADNDPLLVRTEALALERLEAPTDCILISELGPSMIPEALAARTLERVADGVGLVIAVRSPYGAIDIAEFARTAPWSKAICPENATEDESAFVHLGGSSVHPIKDLPACYAYGKGRIALVAEYTQDGNRASYEADIPWLIKAMLWTSRQVPEVRIEQVAAPGQGTAPLKFTLPQAMLPGTVTVALSGMTNSPRGDLAVHAWVENFKDDAPLAAQTMALAQGQTEAKFAVPLLPAGPQKMHFRLMRGDKGIDWTTVVLDVQAPLGILAVERVNDKPYHLSGEPIIGKVRLSAPLEEGRKLNLRLWDADGRLWSEVEPEGRGPEIAFALAPPSPVVLWHRIEARVVAPEGALATRDVEFAIVRTNRHETGFFDYQMWCLPDNDCVLRQFRDEGVVSGAYVGGTLAQARNNIRPLPAVGYHWPGPEQKPGVYYPYHRTRVSGDVRRAPERTPCFTDTNFLAQALAKMVKDAAPQGRYAPIGYGLAHEWNLLDQSTLGKVDICFSPTCQESLRAFLQREYPSIPALNASWGTAFRDWSEVTPIVLGEAVKTNQVVRWIDHRRHMDRVLTDFLKARMAEVRKTDPLAQGAGDNFQMGETLLNSYSGVDYSHLLREAVTWSGNPVSYMRAFTPPERRSLQIARDAAWHPSVLTTDEALLRVRLGNQPWRSLFMGMYGFGFFPGDAFGQPATVWHAWTGADLRPRPLSRYGAESIARIRSGVSRFIYESRPDNSGIAMLYSRASEHAATAWQAHHLDACATRLHPPAQVGFFKTALESLGYGYEALADDQIAAGALQEHGCRLLVLPFSQAVSTAAVDRIRAWVARGGTVLADVRPAVSDQHGKPGTGGALDDLFGVAQSSGYADYAPAEGTVNVKGNWRGLALSAEIADAIAGPPLRVTGGTAFGRCADRPAFIVQRNGRGAGILMNCAPPNGKAAHATLNALLNWRNLEPLLDVVAEAEGAVGQGVTAVATAGEPMADAEGFSAGSAAGDRTRPSVALFRSGRIQTFAAWFYPRRWGSVRGRMTVKPPAPGHVYDLRTGAYLGRIKDRLTVDTPLEALLAYAVTPYRIEPPTLRVNAERQTNGSFCLLAEARTQPRAARRERHVIHFRLYAPDGSEWRDFAASETACHGETTHRVELPLNAPSGTWKVVASEAISGLERSAKIDVANGSVK